MLKRRRRIAAIVLPLLALLLAAAVWRCSRGGGAETGELHRSGFGLMSTSAELVFASGAREPFARRVTPCWKVESVCNVFDRQRTGAVNARRRKSRLSRSPMLYEY